MWKKRNLFSTLHLLCCLPPKLVLQNASCFQDSQLSPKLNCGFPEFTISDKMKIFLELPLLCHSTCATNQVLNGVSLSMQKIYKWINLFGLCSHWLHSCNRCQWKVFLGMSQGQDSSRPTTDNISWEKQQYWRNRLRSTEGRFLLRQDCRTL